MTTIKISTNQNTIDSYSVCCGENIVEQVSRLCDLQKYSKVFVVTDQNLADNGWLYQLEKAINLTKNQLGSITIPAGEKYKNLETLSQIWQSFNDFGLDRKSLVINLGGGVVGDMGGFAARTYLRGLDFVQIPTTLLSMVDASVGGKLAVDFGVQKNMIGLFCQPRAVLVDPNFLSTLPKRELNSGFAEMVKHGLIASEQHFENLELFADPKTNLHNLIAESIQIKANVVAQDPTEKGLRKILNFGHTLGHAFESISLESSQPLLHGEAVSLGIVAESLLSLYSDRINQQKFERIVGLLSKFELPTDLKRLDWANDNNFEQKVFELISKDKKNDFGKTNWSLINGIGNCDFDVLVSTELVAKTIKQMIIDN
jgi:3-dehydroquinate synthase